MRDAPHGSVVLRGVKIDLNTDIGTGFTLDCCRHVEDLVTAEQLKAKYQLDETAWRQLAENEPLQRAVERTRERRVRSGEAAKEAALHLFLAVPNVLSSILNDSAASPRHRIEACRELRQTAAIGADAAAPAAEHFIIKIDLTAGGNPDDVIVVDVPDRKVGPDAKALDHDADATPPPLTAIAANKRDEP
jgi:hypothetical protein